MKYKDYFVDEDPTPNESSEEEESEPDQEEEDEDEEDTDKEDFDEYVYSYGFVHEDPMLLLVLVKASVILFHCIEVTQRARKPETLCAR